MSTAFRKIKLIFKKSDSQYPQNYRAEIKSRNKNTVITRHDLLIAHEMKQRTSLERSNSIRNLQSQGKRRSDSKESRKL
ncbi:BBM_1a_G0056240.mRNA.1.CDS.1 [Saccharomyces cerevisiae]|nr:CEQ_1a_G0056310.mRNA.1.CDS.1 [Saccharomyces cerevisiae]CAI4853325.1 BBM_1a_G0056240.mRNA.1.CDS.1 [Saccharomyces cerevisiae]CAI7391034.1 BBM_1a_G0056240.mRNA.1.CDS.1 [Saccharomyces cerevisiae]CAI7469309.1 CEQ_1a_G0056310.mRNA.1.CDS.1 [Saccharomyces cerevisiae]